MEGYEIGGSIRGHRIIAEAGKVSDPVINVKSARYKAQRIVLTENAYAIVDRKDRWCGQGLVFLNNAATVGGHFYHALAAIYNLDLVSWCTRRRWSSPQVPDDGGGPLDYLACCYLVYGVLIQESDFGIGIS